MPSNPLRESWRRRVRRGSFRKPVLSLAKIRQWIGEYHEQTGSYPRRDTGPIPGSLGESWFKVDKALRYGTRGLPGGSSLAQLLESEYGVRNVANLPPLTIEKILSWCDSHRAAMGDWPHKESGEVRAARGEVWMNVDAALRQGLRGLPESWSLPRLLAEHRGVVNLADRPLLSEDQIAGWVKAYHEAAGRYPTSGSGPIAGSDGDTWLAIDTALHRGSRGLEGETSLADLLARRFGVRNPADPPPLTVEQILTWADLHFQRTGQWPKVQNGPVTDAAEETWGAINKALKYGHRGLKGGSGLMLLLTSRRKIRNNWHLPPLTEDRIWAWMQSYHAGHGSWPTIGSGAVKEAAEETWKGLDAALRKGRRTLPGGSSLTRLRAARLGQAP